MTNRGLTGVAGEYYVAAELSRHGYIASITSKNTKGIDLLVTNQKGDKSASIQIKRRSRPLGMNLHYKTQPPSRCTSCDFCEKHTQMEVAWATSDQLIR